MAAGHGEVPMDEKDIGPLLKQMDIEEVIPQSSSRYVAPTRMEFEPKLTASDLFQLPFDERDVACYRRPGSQPKKEPMNCGAVSGNLLRLLTMKESEELTKKGAKAPSAYVENWPVFLKNTLQSGDVDFKTENVSDIPAISRFLFSGHATIVFGRRSGSGHVFVLRRIDENHVEILDPQSLERFDAMEEYIRKEQFFSYIAIFFTKPLTPSQISNIHLEGVLSKNIASLSLNGRKGGGRGKTKGRKMRRNKTRKQKRKSA